MKNVFQAVEERDALCVAVHHYLKDIGIKTQTKLKSRSNPRSDKTQTHLSLTFGGCLSHMPQVTISVDGTELHIPSFLWMSTKYLRSHIRTEGLFRKGGSISRQKELKKTLENGGSISDQADIHDVANLVKQFLRCLTEPLLPLGLHSAFIKAHDLEDTVQRTEAILMICILLPMENLHALRFVMMFFAEIASYSPYNKMDANNLAIILAPNLFGVTNEVEKREKVRDTYLAKQTGLIQFLIENADTIGTVPDHLLLYLSHPFSHSEDDLDASHDGDRRISKKRNRKKRNSLNGVLHGLRKMVNNSRTGGGGGGPTIWHDDDEEEDGNGALLDREGGLERTPSQAMKRKLANEQSPAQCTNAKQRAVARGAKSTKAVPVPIHLDSPNPVQGNEDQVFSSPMLGIALGDSNELQRKSCRMKIFGKGYFCTRSGNLRMSKSATKPPKKDANNSSKKQGNETVGRRLSGDELHASPPLSLTPYKGTMQLRSQTKVTNDKHSVPVSSASCSREIFPETNTHVVPTGQKKTTPLYLPESSYGVSPITLSRLSRSPRLKDFMDWKTTALGSPSTSEKMEVSSKPDWKGRRSKLMEKLNVEAKIEMSLRRSRSINRRKSPRLLDVGVSDIELFTPPRHPVIRLTGCSLRRGRPNTIGTGLPPPPSPQPKATEITSDLSWSPGHTLLHYTSDPGPISESNVIKTRMSGSSQTRQSTAARFSAAMKSSCKNYETAVKEAECHFGPGSKQEEESSQKSHRHLTTSPRGLPPPPPCTSMKKIDSGIFEMVSSDELEVVDNADTKRTPNKEDTCWTEKLANSSREFSSETSDSGLRPLSIIISNHVKHQTLPRDALTDKVIGSSQKSRETTPKTKNVSPSVREGMQSEGALEWKPASVILGTPSSNDASQTSVGRPSIVRLMIDRAGSVSAATRKFNALAAVRSEQESRGLVPPPPSQTPPINSLCWHSPKFITPIRSAKHQLVPCPVTNIDNESRYRKKSLTVGSASTKLNRWDNQVTVAYNNNNNNNDDKLEEKVTRLLSRVNVKENLPQAANKCPTRNKSSIGSASCPSSSVKQRHHHLNKVKATTVTSSSLRPRPAVRVVRSKSARVTTTYSPDSIVRRSPRLKSTKGNGGGENSRKLKALPRRTTSM